MREYETVYILQPMLNDADQQKLGEKWQNLITKNNGKIIFNKLMGKKTLAYPIQKQTKGVYFCLDYAAGGDTVKNLEKQMKLDENVMRFLTVVRDEDVDVEARLLEVATEKESSEEKPAETEENA